jgi:hypothetical protein
MSKAKDDPFNALQDQVRMQLEKIKIKQNKLKSLMTTVDTMNNSEFKELQTGF